MIYIISVLAFGIVLGVLYEVAIAPRLWMRKHGDGLYNAKVKFLKNNLNIKGD
jgi:hypothetical protein